MSDKIKWPEQLDYRNPELTMYNIGIKTGMLLEEIRDLLKNPPATITAPERLPGLPIQAPAKEQYGQSKKYSR